MRTHLGTYFVFLKNRLKFVDLIIEACSFNLTLRLWNISTPCKKAAQRRCGNTYGFIDQIDTKELSFACTFVPKLDVWFLSYACLDDPSTERVLKFCMLSVGGWTDLRRFKALPVLIGVQTLDRKQIFFRIYIVGPSGGAVDLSSIGRASIVVICRRGVWLRLTLDKQLLLLTILLFARTSCSSWLKKFGFQVGWRTNLVHIRCVRQYLYVQCNNDSEQSISRNST